MPPAAPEVPGFGVEHATVRSLFRVALVSSALGIKGAVGEALDARPLVGATAVTSPEGTVFSTGVDMGPGTMALGPGVSVSSTWMASVPLIEVAAFSTLADCEVVSSLRNFKR